MSQLIRLSRPVAPAVGSFLLTLLAGCAWLPHGTPKAAVAQQVAMAAAVPPRAATRPFEIVSNQGTRSDEYYWLRDDKRESKEVLAYLDAENAYRDALLKPTEPLQEKLFKELTDRLPPDDASVPVLDHGWWIYQRYEAGKEYPIFARRKGSLQAAEQVMLDGNALAQGAEYYKIGDTEISPDGKLLAYAEDRVGRRQYTLKVKNLDTGALMADTVVNVEPNLIWAADNRTLLYVAKDPVTLLSVKVRKHTLGSDAAKDPLVYEEKDSSYYMGLAKSKSDRYLFISLNSTLTSEIRYADASDPLLAFRPVLPRKKGHEYQAEHLGTDFILRTNERAANFRIVRAPIATAADRKTWKDVMPARADAYIESFEPFRDHLVVNERSGGLLKLHVRRWDGREDYVIGSDEPSYAETLSPTPDLDSTALRYVHTSLATPPTTYRFDLVTGERAQLKRAAVAGYEPSNYTTEFLRAPARDGTLVPVSLVYRKGTPRDGTAPLFQHGYGSYGSSFDPEFDSSWVSMLDRGFVVAIAHVRGGQELGRAWYEGGKLLNKKNSFSDFVDVTKYLVDQRYAAADKVFAEGRSAGGLLMGAVVNLAPEAYRGVLVGVPFVDVVTTMLDESIPLTTNEFDEWGNPKQKAYYDYMLSYSPYDNITAKAYPAMYVSTGLWDSQVQYYEPAKYVARLRETGTGNQPLILSTDMAAGHGGKPGRYEKYHETAREYAFLFSLIGITQ